MYRTPAIITRAHYYELCVFSWHALTKRALILVSLTK